MKTKKQLSCQNNYSDFTSDIFNICTFYHNNICTVCVISYSDYMYMS